MENITRNAAWVAEQEQAHANQSIADRWSGCGCWLDGRPATVLGRLNPFASIATLDSRKWTGRDPIKVEFAWPTVERSKEFRS